MLELHHMWLSAVSGVVRFALDVKGLQYDSRIHTPGITDLRIKRLAGKVSVPVLVDDGAVIQGSDHILEHLEKKNPTPNLLGEDDRERAEIAKFSRLLQDTLPVLREEVVSRVMQRLPGVTKESPVGFLPEIIRVPIGRLVLWQFGKKYAFTHERIERLREQTVQIFTDLRESLGDETYFVGRRLTAADIIVCELLATLRPPEHRFAPVGLESRQAYTADWLSDEVIGPWAQWRDQLYATHRGSAGSP